MFRIFLGSSARRWTMLAVLLSGMSVMGAAQAADASPPRCADDGPRANAVLEAIFGDDQAARSGTGPKDWAAIRRDDAKRRVEVRKIVDAGQLACATDYVRAAFVFQHGETPDDFLLAHVLATAAIVRDEANARWLAAATLDRYLMATGKAQVFGTQFNTPKDQPANQEPFDSALLSDGVRAAFGVPDRAAQAKQRDSYDASRGIRK